ncbi:hypothetical protein KXW60_006014 [Aspergillus fumigatus]|nr:hypothetical protein KXW60_006014 [Aspergillus fumigatus]
MGRPLSMLRNSFSIQSDRFRKNLESSRIPSALDASSFVPISELRRLVQGPMVIKILEEHGYSSISHAELAATIVQAAPRLFALLVWIGQPQLALSLGYQCLNDENLPLDDYKLESLNFRATSGWSKNWETKILQEQWIFLSPIWHREGEILSDTPPSAPLPLTFASSVRKDSANSTIRQIKIHPAHLPFYAENNDEAPILALKLFKTRGKKRFDHEISVLQLLNRRSNPNIIRLLVAISTADRRGLVFPWAQCDLSELMEQEIPSNQRKELARWILQQFVGLLSGLATIHCIPSSDGGRSCLQARHGDLRPANILLMRDSNTSLHQSADIASCRLQIASMAMTDLFKDESQYTIPSETGTYQGPECHLQHATGPLYDIWSLGCIFLEMIIWLVEGQSGLAAFASDRDAPDPLLGERVRDDYFFTLKVKEGSYIGAEVRPSVLSWLK